MVHQTNKAMLLVQAAKARGKPYTIVFVGVNGVGKSTNLAKVAYWLLQHDISVRFLTAHPAYGYSSICAVHACM